MASEDTQLIPTDQDMEKGKPKSRLSNRVFFAFALGAFVSMATHTAVGFYFQEFLLEVAGVSAPVVSACVFLGRAWDAFTDPMVGHLVSITNTRWGSLKPWMAASIIPCVIVYFFMWFIPNGTNAKSAYAIIMYLLYQTLFSCYQVPYTSLTMHLTPDPKQRDLATTYRMVVETLALVMGSIVQGYITTYFKIKASSGAVVCRNCSSPDPEPHEVNQTVVYGYWVSAGLIGILCIVSGAVAVFGIPEEKKAPKPRQDRASFYTNMKQVFRERTFMKLVLMFMWAWMANNVNQANFVLWLKYGFNRDSEVFYFLLTMVATTTVMLGVWRKLVDVLGKPMCFAIGLAMQVPSSMAWMLLPEDIPSAVMHVLICWGAIGLGAVYLIPWLMLSDVVDESHLKGERKEALFYSFFVFFQKFAAGIAVGLSALALSFADYETQVCCGETQPPTVRVALMLLASVAPTVLLLLSLVSTACYPLTPARLTQIKFALDEKREKEREAQLQRKGEAVPLSATSEKHDMRSRNPVFVDPASESSA
eukprot:m.202159 g.202159  ORF g.202159 m.202159 type:complete len:534 (+) comp14976_c0_seq20:122-1723(+)